MCLKERERTREIQRDRRGGGKDARNLHAPNDRLGEVRDKVPARVLGLAVSAVVQAPHRDGHDLHQRVPPARGEVCGLIALATRWLGLQLGGWCLYYTCNSVAGVSHDE